ncbi:hypothetical protein T310_8017, partial [Rasamsonia emersonii CBS 393.64]
QVLKDSKKLKSMRSNYRNHLDHGLEGHQDAVIAIKQAIIGLNALVNSLLLYIVKFIKFGCKMLQDLRLCWWLNFFLGDRAARWSAQLGGGLR